MSATPTTVEPDDAVDRPVPRWLLLFALSGGMIGWFLRLVGGSALVPVACAQDMWWLIDAWTVLHGLVCVAAIAAAWQVHRRAGPGDDSRAVGYRLLGFVAIAINVLSLVLVIAEGQMHIWFGACR